MTYKGCTVSMVFDAEDKITVGSVQDTDDIIALHGESVAEFESSFHAAIENYLAASMALGSAPEKPTSGKLMLRIAPEVHAAAFKAAARSGTSLNKWAESTLGKAARNTPARATARVEAQPELFVKRVHSQTGLDGVRRTPDRAAHSRQSLRRQGRRLGGNLHR